MIGQAHLSNQLITFDLVPSVEVFPSPEQEKSPDILVRSGHMAPRTQGQRVPYLSIVMTGEGGGVRRDFFESL